MSRYKTILALALVLVLLLTGAAGCASRSPSPVTQETTSAARPAAEAGGGNAFDKSLAPSATGQTGGTATPGEIASFERKIVRNASVGLEVVDVRNTYDQILTYAKARQGYETMRNEQLNNDILVLYATIKIKPEELDGFLQYIGTLGRLINCRISTDDITTQYYDATTRLQTMEKSLERYNEFLDRAQTIEEVLQVQNYINQLTVEIESLKGMLRLWDSMLAESSVSFEIRQVNDPVKIKKEITWSTLSWADMTYLMRSGLTRLCNGVVSILQWLLIAVVTLSPILIILLIIYLIRRRRRARKANQKQPPAANP